MSIYETSQKSSTIERILGITFINISSISLVGVSALGGICGAAPSSSIGFISLIELTVSFTMLLLLLGCSAMSLSFFYVPYLVEALRVPFYLRGRGWGSFLRDLIKAMIFWVPPSTMRESLIFRCPDFCEDSCWSTIVAKAASVLTLRWQMKCIIDLRVSTILSLVNFSLRKYLGVHFWIVLSELAKVSRRFLQ